MKLNDCKCGCTVPVRESKRTDADKLVYYVACPKCKNATIAHHGAYKQKAAKEWNTMNPREA